MEAVIAAVQAAFEVDAPRPANADLLHPDCRDDMDLHRLYEVPSWQEMTDDDVVAEYAALAFLSADGFRHFVPAYLTWVLRHPEAAEAVVDSTVWAFALHVYAEELRPFVASKWTTLTDDQREAVGAFLRAMAPLHPDAARAAASGEWPSRIG